jgi:FAD:protein FMN transferase
VLKLKYLKIRTCLNYINIIILLLLFLCSNAFAEERYLLGTICKITIYDSEVSESAKNTLLNNSFEIISDIDHRMSSNVLTNLNFKLWENELFEINSNAGIRPATVSEDILYLIELSNYYSEISDGRFDITIGPLIKLWNIGTQSAKVPLQEEITESLDLVNYRNIELDKESGSVFLKSTGMMIDLGGIAKGFAGDRVKEFLVDNGIEHAVINLGGNVLVIGIHPDNRPWRIGVQNQFMPTGTVMGIINASDEAIVTSGIYERYFIKDGIRYHHILDTETGYPVDNSLAGVTIVTDDSTKADALSTAVFSMGYKRGLSLIEELENTEAVFITKDKDVYISSGIEERFSITDNSFNYIKIN